MGKKSFWERIFGTSHSPKGLKRRGLKVENLEERQLLSVVGWETTPTAASTTTNPLVDASVASGNFKVDYTATISDVATDASVTLAMFYDSTKFTPNDQTLVPVQDLNDLDNDLKTDYFYLRQSTGGGETETFLVDEGDAVGQGHLNGQAYEGNLTEITATSPRVTTETGASTNVFNMIKLDTPAVTVTPTSGTIGLTWRDIPNANSYTVLYTIGSGTEQTATVTDSNYTIADTNGNEVAWSVVATDTGNVFTTSAVETGIVLATPTSFASSAHTDTTITLSWNVVTHAASYTVFASDGVNDPLTQTFDTNGGTFDGLTKATSYTLTVIANPEVASEYINSAESASISVTTNSVATAPAITWKGFSEFGTANTLTAKFYWDTTEYDTQVASYTVKAYTVDPTSAGAEATATWTGLDNSYDVDNQFSVAEVSPTTGAINLLSTQPYWFTVTAVAKSGYGADATSTVATLAAPDVAIDATKTAVDTLVYNWTAPANAGIFVAEYSTGTGWIFIDSTKITNVDTTYTLTFDGLTANTGYTVRVKSQNSSNTPEESWWDVTTPAYTLAVAPTLADPTLGTDGETVTLDWDDTSTSGYNAYVSIDGAEFVKINTDVLTASTTTYTIAADKSYDFKVAALNGDSVENFSNVVNAYKFVAPTISTITPSYNAEDGFGYRLTASWDSVSTDAYTVTGYKLEYTADTTGTWAEENITGDVTTFTAKGLVPNTQYTFRVTAIGAPAITTFDSDVSATKAAYTLAAAPELTVGTSLNAEGKLVLNWTQTGTSDGYNVWVNGTKITGETPVDKDLRTYTYADFVKDTSYSIYIEAINADGVVTASNIVTAYQFDTPVITVTPSYDETDGNILTVAWDSVSSTDPAYTVANYTLEYTDDPDAAVPVWTSVTVAESDAPSYQLKNLDFNKQYTFRVTALATGLGSTTEGVYDSAVSEEEAAYTKAAAPVLTISSTFVDDDGEEAMALSWQMPAGKTAKSFMVYVNGSTLGIPVTGTTEGTYNFKDFTAGYNYTFKVAALNGDDAETLSDQVTGYQFATPTITLIAPGYDATDRNILEVSWGSVSRTNPDYIVANYTLEYSTNPDAETPVWTKVTDLIGDSANPSYSLKNLDYNTEYTFRVAADGITDGSGTNVIYASATSNTSAKFTWPNAPTSLTVTDGGWATATSSWTATLNWTDTNTDPASKYNVYYREVTDPVSDWTAGAAGVTELTASVAGLSAGKTYEFKVNAVNGDSIEDRDGIVKSAYKLVAPNIGALNNITDSSIKVDWNTSEDPALIANYTVNYMPGTGTYTTTDANELSHTFNSLTSNTEYTFGVRSNAITTSTTTIDYVLSSELSAPDSAWTYAVAPTVNAPTLNVDGDLVLTWTMPDGETAATNFKAEYKTATGDWTQIGGLVAGDVFTTTFVGFAAGTLYEFRVSALNGAETAVPTVSTNTVKAAQFVTPVIEGSIEATLDGNDEFVLSPEWNSVSIDALAPKYTLQWKLASEDTTEWDSDTTTAITYDVDSYKTADLLGNTLYEFKVTAGLPDTAPNDITLFASGTSAVVTGLTLADAPTIVSDTVTSTTATITWEMPEGAELTGVKYNVYRVDGAINTPIEGAQGLEVTQYPITGLTPGTDYYFSVSAVNTSGENYSDSYLVTTNYADPAGTVAPTANTPWDLTFDVTSALPLGAAWRVLRSASSTADPNVSTDGFETVVSSAANTSFTFAESSADTIRAGGYYYWVQTFGTLGEGTDEHDVVSRYVSMNTEAVTVTPKELADAVIAIDDQDVDTVLFSFEPVVLTDTTTEVAGYVVKFSGAPDSGITPITYTIAKGDTEYWDDVDGCYYVDFDNLIAGTTYTFDVDAYALFSEGVPVANDLAYASSCATEEIYTDLADPVVTQVTGTEAPRSFEFAWTQTPINGTANYLVEVFEGGDATGTLFWLKEYTLAEKPASIKITESNGTVVTPVTPDTQYFVRVTASAADEITYADGIGYLSITTEALTPLTTPNLLLGGLAPSIGGFTVNWNASLPADQVAKYVVVYQLGTATPISQDVPADQTTYTATGLVEGGEYNISIKAIAVENGNYSDSLVAGPYSVTTLKSIPEPVEGEEVIIEDPTANSLLVEWDPVDEENQDLVSGYTVEVLNPAGDVVEEIFVPGAASDHIEVDGLASGSDYTFNVYANPSDLGKDEGYDTTLLGTGTGQTAYADPIWDLANYNFATYVLSVDNGVATLKGYAKNSRTPVELGSFNVQPGNTPVIIGAQNAKENFMIADSAREYFDKINVLGGGVKNFYVRRDTLVVSGTEGDDIATVNHVSGTGTILDTRDVLGSGMIQITTPEAETAEVTFSGMKQVLVNTEAGNDTFKVNEMTAYYTWLVAKPGEGEMDFDEDTLDFSTATTINDRTNVTGAIVNLNATYQMVAGQIGRLKLAAGDQAVEKIIGSKAIDTIISGKQGIEFVDESGSRNIINLTRSETGNTVNVAGDYQTILGGKGDDVITVLGNYCTVNMTRDGSNVVNITGDHNTVIGGDGEDWVDVRGSRNVINTLGGDDTVQIYNNGDAKADGNIVHLGNGDDRLFASYADGTANKNFFYGEGGNDIIIGSGGNDYIYGGGGSNVLIGMRGKDYIYGGSENDLMAGNDFEKLIDALYSDGEYNPEGVENLIGAVLTKIAEGDYAGVLDLTGAATSDGEKDFMYRGGGYNHLFFQSLASTDKDFVNPLTAGKHDDWVITDEIQ